ncbi:tannase/feruloyl esterase family alpha/beta hydrolase, partial [Novosphingobium sp. 11B]
VHDKFVTLLSACGLSAMIAASALASTDHTGQAMAAKPGSEKGSSRCEALAGRSLAGAQILSAQPVAAGTTLASQYGGSATVTTPMCRVKGQLRPTSDSDIRFEVWLPTSANWNHLYQAIGGGGNSGNFSMNAIRRALDTGYAVSGQDNGHAGQSDDATYAIGHPEKVRDFGWRSLHLVAVASKAVIAAYYGSAQEISLFNGCSTGGRQALAIAQRFPEDYDGISAGAPANYWPELNAFGAKFGRFLMDNPGSWVSPEKLSMVQSAVLKTCGGVNGVIDNVQACHFDVATLACSGADSKECLTRLEIAGLKARFADLIDDEGNLLYPGYSPGLETSLGRMSFGATRETRWYSSGAARMPEGFFRDYVHADPDWTISQFEWKRDLQAAREGVIGQAVAAESPDLSKFMKRGGKLIQWHGWQDMAIPARNSVRYREAVLKTMGAEKANGFYRLFMAPGVDHCAGGPGPDSIGANGTTVPGADADHDVMAALVRWIRQNKAPDQIIATKFGTDGAVVAQRPWCAYPQVARWDGKGDWRRASSYQCTGSSTGTAVPRRAS